MPSEFIEKSKHQPTTADVEKHFGFAEGTIKGKLVATPNGKGGTDYVLTVDPTQLKGTLGEMG